MGRASMNCPENKEPLGYDRQGRAYPLIIAPRLLEEARKRFPRLWIEPNQPIKRVGWQPL